MIICHDDDSGDSTRHVYQNLQYMTSFKVHFGQKSRHIRICKITLLSTDSDSGRSEKIQSVISLTLKMNALVVREISKANGTFGFELEHDEKGPKKREGAHQVNMYYTLLK